MRAHFLLSCLFSLPNVFFFNCSPLRYPSGEEWYRRDFPYPGGGGYMCSNSLAKAITEHRVGPGFFKREQPSDYGPLEANLIKMSGGCLQGEVGCIPIAVSKAMCHLGVKSPTGLVCCNSQCGGQCGAEEGKCDRAVGGHSAIWAMANCCQNPILVVGAKCLKFDDTSCTMAAEGNGDHTNTVPGDHIPTPAELEAAKAK